MDRNFNYNNALNIKNVLKIDYKRKNLCKIYNQSPPVAYSMNQMEHTNATANKYRRNLVNL